MRKQQEDERKIFDFIQEWPLDKDIDPDIDPTEIDNEPSYSPNSGRPVLSLQRFQSDQGQKNVISSSKLEAEQMEHSNKFDIIRERRAGNNFWKHGLGREEHRAMETAAKVKRLEKGDSNVSAKQEDKERA